MQIRTVIAAMLFVFAAGCGAFSDSAKPRITHGEDHASIVRLPGGSRPTSAALADGHTRTHRWGSEVFFNLSPDSQRVLFRVFDPGSNGVHFAGDSVFALSLRRFEIDRATEADWSTGIRIAPPDRSERYALLGGANAADDGDSYLFEGRKYRHTGKIGGNFFASPGRKYVAVSSYDKDTMTGGFDLIPYTFFIDIYDLTNGSRLSSAELDVAGWDPNRITLDDSMNWATDRYLYVPLTPDHGKCLLFHF